MSIALRSVGFRAVLSNTPVESSRRAPCSQARLRRPAANPQSMITGGSGTGQLGTLTYFRYQSKITEYILSRP